MADYGYGSGDGSGSTLDCVGLWQGHGALIDLKTGDPRDVAADLQTAGYLGMLLEMQSRGETPAMVQFEPLMHAYYLEGQRIPSVTQVLQWAGLIDFSGIPQEILRAARDRGTAVHQACHYYNEADLDVQQFQEEYPEYWPYLAAWVMFRAESGFELATEIPKTIRRYAVRLKKTGQYQLDSYTDPKDYAEFTTLVAAWHVAAKRKGAFLGVAEVA